MGEGLDSGADGGEAVLTGGRQVLQEAEVGENRRLGGDHLGGRGVVVEFYEEADEAFDERRLGIVAEVETPVGDGAEEPYGGDATGDAVGVGLVVGGERRATSGVGDDGGEALLAVFDDGEVLGELRLFFGDGHGAN